ncbi:MAG: nucleoside hydrolase [Bryobacterales bacterium]|jgi:inosine-uridine nucleoside N-ribohydrolase|nr:nucleoside hydrolase [Bryobacterales bacterium]
MKPLVLLACTLALAPCAAWTSPVPVIFDTDMGNDVDDALALAVLHALESRGECRLIAVTVTKDNRWSAPYVDLVNTFYGRAHIPVGVVKGSGITPKDSAMIQAPAERKRSDGRLVYPRRLASGEEAPDAVPLLRRVLAAEPDASVVIVQVGFSTNLARLLDSAPDSHSPLPGRELAARKVKLLSIMAGNFADGTPEYNVQEDVPSAQKLLAGWPTRIVASGFEIGRALLYPASSIERDFSYTADHPVADAYRNYQKMPYDRPTWDLTSALYGVRPDAGYFTVSPPGRITADAKGGTRFTPDPNGRHHYLILSGAQRPRVLEALVQLASQPPSVR